MTGLSGTAHDLIAGTYGLTPADLPALLVLVAGVPVFAAAAAGWNRALARARRNLAA